MVQVDVITLFPEVVSVPLGASIVGRAQERGALTLAVRQFPQMNARFDDEAGVVTRHGAVHIGIATQTTSGLMVPVVRHAENRDLWSNAAEVTRRAPSWRFFCGRRAAAPRRPSRWPFPPRIPKPRR